MQKDLTRGSPLKTIILFAIPMFIGNFFQQAYQLTDALIVGHFVGAYSFAAVTQSSYITTVLLGLIIGAGVGASVVISQLFGARRYEDLKRAVSTTFIFMAAVTVVLSVAGVFLARPVLSLINTSPDFISSAQTYLMIIFGGLATMLVYNVCSSILRGIGNSVMPLVFLIVAAVMNILLDLLFVAVFKMGISGAAIATIVSQAVSSILCIVYTYKKVPLLAVKRKEWVFDRGMFRLIVKTSLPGAVQQVSIAVGSVIMQAILNSFGDNNTVLGFSAASRVDQFAILPILSLGLALSTYAAQNKGAGNLDNIKRGLWRGILFMWGMCVVTVTLIILLGAPLIHLMFDAEKDAGVDMQEVLKVGIQYFWIILPFYPVFGLMNNINNCLRGTGDIIFPLFITVSQLVVRIIAAFLLRPVLDSYLCVLYAFPIGWGYGAILAVINYLTGRWKKHKLIRPAAEAATE